MFIIGFLIFFYGELILAAIGIVVFIGCSIWLSSPAQMTRIRKQILKFLLCFFVMTVCCALYWNHSVEGRLYSCTDPVLLGYLHPGDWVHAYNGIAYVKDVQSPHLYSSPDYLKEGWTESGLWGIWSSLFAVTICGSFVAAKIRAKPHSHDASTTLPGLCE
jgi:hypothetical protein